MLKRNDRFYLRETQGTAELPLKSCVPTLPILRERGLLAPSLITPVEHPAYQSEAVGVMRRARVSRLLGSS
jgi:hypothetical protein